MLKIVQKMRLILILGLGSASLMVLALGTVICLPGMASADTIVQLAYKTVTNAGTPTIWDPSQNNKTGGWLTVYAGNYVVSIQNGPALSGHCVDPQDSNSSYQTYTLQPLVAGSGYQAAAWVLSNEVAKGWSAEAAQCAIWELTWDWGANPSIPFSLTAGNFQLSTADITKEGVLVKTIYDDALTGIANGKFNSSGYVLAYSPNFQNYVVPNPNHAPIPATALLLGSGLLGLGLLIRKKKAVLVRGDQK